MSIAALCRPKRLTLVVAPALKNVPVATGRNVPIPFVAVASLQMDMPHVGGAWIVKPLQLVRDETNAEQKDFATNVAKTLLVLRLRPAPPVEKRIDGKSITSALETETERLRWNEMATGAAFAAVLIGCVFTILMVIDRIMNFPISLRCALPVTNLSILFYGMPPI